MSTPPSGGEGQNPYGNQPPSDSGDPYRQQPSPPFPYGQQGPGSGSQSPYGGGGAQPSQPSYGSQPPYGGSQPSQPSYGAQQPSYGEPAPPTQQFGSPSYGQQAAQPTYGQPGYGQQPSYGQQPPYRQYGQPDWSGAPAGPPKKSRTPLIASIVALVVLLIVALLLILPQSPLGLGGKVFDEQQVAEDISQQYEDEFGLQIDVVCPANQEVVSGDTFTCEGETAEGDTVELDIEITSDDGDYTWSEAA